MTHASTRRVVLITGIAGGIGYATAQMFAAEGWGVIGCDRGSTPPPGLELDHYLTVDLANAEAVMALVHQLPNHCDRLDALVNNAAWQVCQSALTTSVSDWDQVMAVNLRSPFLLAQGTYPQLKATQGAIINVSSVHAIATSANIAAYAASKGGLLALTRALAIEFAPEVRVNALLPGAVDTPMLRSGLERGHLAGTTIADLLDHLGQKTVLGKVGQPKEIAQAILFLADNEKSSFMTGQALVVDGGATARLSTE